MDESARDWNRLHPPGAPVRMRLIDGRKFVGITARHAQQWGGLPVIRLKNNTDVHTISALEPVTWNDRVRCCNLTRGTTRINRERHADQEAGRQPTQAKPAAKGEDSIGKGGFCRTMHFMEGIEITQLLGQWRSGDQAAGARLTELFYPLLRTIARRELQGGRFGLSLNASDLAHEAFLRVYGAAAQANNRAHFLAIVSQVVRRVLIDLLRARAAQKRGAGLSIVSLELNDADAVAETEKRIDWLDLEQALTALELRDPIAARIVEMRYFGGMTTGEVAEELQIATSTVGRHWEFARAWLHRRL